MSFACRFFAALLGLCPSGAALAAEFWLRPDRFNATPGATLGAEIVVFGETPVSGMPAVSRAEVTLAGAPVPVGLDPWSENQRSQRISATFARPGWAVWCVAVGPFTESLAASELASRLHPFYAPSPIRERILGSGASSRWRLSLQSTLKCIVTIGEPDPSDRSWREGGIPIWDLIPRSDLAAVRAGQSAGFTILAGTVPAAGAVVTLRSIAGEREFAAPVRADGSVDFVIADPGLWLASASHVQVSSSDKSLLEVRTVSLVFEVK